jgi:hypothetical protein
MELPPWQTSDRSVAHRLACAPAAQTYVPHGKRNRLGSAWTCSSGTDVTPCGRRHPRHCAPGSALVSGARHLLVDARGELLGDEAPPICSNSTYQLPLGRIPTAIRNTFRPTCVHIRAMIIPRAPQDVRKVSLWFCCATLTTTGASRLTIRPRCGAMEPPVPLHLRRNAFQLSDRLIALPKRAPQWGVQAAAADIMQDQTITGSPLPTGPKGRRHRSIFSAFSRHNARILALQKSRRVTQRRFGLRGRPRSYEKVLDQGQPDTNGSSCSRSSPKCFAANQP